MVRVGAESLSTLEAAVWQRLPRAGVPAPTAQARSRRRSQGRSLLPEPAGTASGGTQNPGQVHV